MSGTTLTRANTVPAVTVSPASTYSSSTMPLICGLIRISFRGPMVPELTDFLMMSAMRGAFWHHSMILLASTMQVSLISLYKRVVLMH